MNWSSESVSSLASRLVSLVLVSNGSLACSGTCLPLRSWWTPRLGIARLRRYWICHVVAEDLLSRGCVSALRREVLSADYHEQE